MNLMQGMERICRVGIAGLMLCMLAPPAASASSREPTVDDLKARVANTGTADRPPLCLRISELQLEAAGKFYLAGDSEKAQAALSDVVTYAEMTRDSAIQSRKHEKQSEIAIRKMTRKLADLKHSVTREEQEQIQSTIDRLQRIRDDLLAAMFPKGAKK